MRLNPKPHTTRPDYDVEPGPIAQVFVFKDEACLGWDCFSKQTIRIGRDPAMDICLKDAAVAGKHAEVYIRSDKIVVSALTHELQLRVNDQPVTSAILNPLDFMAIGPYTLKIKLPRIKNKRSPKTLPKSEPTLTARPHVIEKWRKHADKLESTKTKIQEKAVTLRAVRSPEKPEIKKKQDITVREFPEKKTLSPSLPKVRPISPELDEDDEREEEEAHIQPFLKSTLLETVPPQGLGTQTDHVLEIVKYKGEVVVDFKCLAPKEKYDIRTDTRHFRLAAYKSFESCHIYFRPSHIGFIKEPGLSDRELTDLCTTENIHRRKKKIYTIRLVAGQAVTLEDGGYRYQLRLIQRSASPQVSVPAKSTKSLFKNLLKSSGIHVVLVLLLSLFLSSPQMPDSAVTEARFVKIDMSQLQQPKKDVPKPKPVRPPRKITRAKAKAPEKQPKATRKTPKKSPKAAPPRKLASSPNAGGGNDVKGNVKTRNIKQTGLLGLIGDGIGLAPKQALAAVTNLDVVSSPNASANNLKIGGIPGKLPGAKLEIVSGDVVRSKGTRQVLRSAGIKGEGDVAALEKGQTGQNKVMALVSVELNKSVRVQGGMSREAVKRVIDQHLDEISYCYENALIGAPSLMGNIVFEWKILMSGKVGAVRIKSSTIRSGQIHHCIQAAIKSWRFEKPQHAEVVVSYPFVFDIVGF